MSGRRRVYGSHVSRVLSRVGFARFDAEPTSVRGHYRYAPGYRAMGQRNAWEEGYVADPESGTVVVSHETLDSYDYGDRRDTRPAAEVRADMLTQYAVALESAGFTVETRARGTEPYLVVTGRAA